jgi:hypothetical protein
VAQRGGAPPALRRQLAALRQVSDADRHVTLLMTRNFLFADGRKLLSGNLEKVLAPLDWLLSDSIQACMFSAHFGDSFYAEARFVGSLDFTPQQLATDLLARVRQVPSQIERYIGGVQLSYWQPLAIRFPAMVRYLADQTRAGSEQGQAILNAVLPGPAAHNLALASQLALTAPESTGAVVPPNVSTGPQSLEDVLQYRMSLEFPQQSLEFALRDLEAELRDALPDVSFPLRIRILGSDLREEGITRNQQIQDFSQSDRPAAELLTGLVMRANPVTTVQSASDPDQKLIWVVAPDPEDPGHQAILITTRRAAQQRGYALPEVFVGQAARLP